MNKTKKILSIILITLLILSTIFTLCKKVGFCASDSSNFTEVTSFPLPFGLDSGYGVSSSLVSSLSSFDFDSIISSTNQVRNEHYDTISVLDFDSSNNIFLFILFSSSFLISSNSGLDTLNTDINVYSPSTSSAIVSYNNGTWDYWAGNRGNWYIYISQHISSSASGTLYLNPDELISGYPIYSLVDSISDTNGNVLFSRYVPGGTDFPGFNHYFWQNYQDSIDVIDGNNSIWKPNYQNPTNQQGFWDNVMDFFNRSFKSLLGGISGATKTIGDYIEQFYNGCMEFWTNCWNTIFDKIDELLGKLFPDDPDDSILADTNDSLDSIDGRISSIETKITTFFNNFWSNFDDYLEDFTEGIWGHLPDIMKAPYRIAQWFYQHGLNNGEFDFMTLFHYLFDFDTTTALNDYRANKYGKFTLDVKDFFNTFFGSIINANANDRVFFTISIGNNLDNTISGSRFGLTIPDITIDFSWYAQIRDTYLPYFMAFLYVTVIWLFFKRLPDILRGVAGAESSFLDGLPQDEFAPTNNGVFTTGVSHNQPSLDKGPISGGGGVHSGASQFWY